MIYISIPIVIYFLYNRNVFSVHFPQSAVHVILAIVFVFVAFLIHSLYWFYLLNASDVKVTKKDALISNGLYVFTKYIPGKVWLILGKAGFLSNRYNHSLTNLSILSLYNQLLGIFIGLCFGVITVFAFPFAWYFKVFTPVLVVVFAFFLFKSNFRDSIGKRIQSKKVLKLINSIPSVGKLHVTLIYITCYWLSLSIGFLFIVDSLIDSPMQVINLTFGYPAAVVIGIIALFAPGGIGIREGALVFVLITAGISTSDSISIAVVSRVWFLIGEVFIFLLALTLNKMRFSAAPIATR